MFYTKLKYIIWDLIKRKFYNTYLDTDDSAFKDKKYF